MKVQPAVAPTKKWQCKNSPVHFKGDTLEKERKMSGISGPGSGQGAPPRSILKIDGESATSQQPKKKVSFSPDIDRGSAHEFRDTMTGMPAGQDLSRTSRTSGDGDSAGIRGRQSMSVDERSREIRTGKSFNALWGALTRLNSEKDTGKIGRFRRNRKVTVDNGKEKISFEYGKSFLRNRYELSWEEPSTGKRTTIGIRSNMKADSGINRYWIDGRKAGPEGVEDFTPEQIARLEMFNAHFMTSSQVFAPGQEHWESARAARVKAYDLPVPRSGEGGRTPSALNLPTHTQGQSVSDKFATSPKNPELGRPPSDEFHNIFDNKSR